MLEGTAAVTRRKDYSAPAFWIDTVDLTIDLDPIKTRVLNKMQVRRNPDVSPQALRLDGEELNLARLSSSPSKRRACGLTSGLRRTCILLRTRVLMGSRSMVRSTVSIQNAGAE